MSKYLYAFVIKLLKLLNWIACHKPIPTLSIKFHLSLCLSYSLLSSLSVCWSAPTTNSPVSRPNKLRQKPHPPRASGSFNLLVSLSACSWGNTGSLLLINEKVILQTVVQSYSVGKASNFGVDWCFLDKI